MSRTTRLPKPTLPPPKTRFGGRGRAPLGAVDVPGVADVLEVQPPTLEGWGVIALMSLVPLGVGRYLRTSGGNWIALGR